MDFRTLRDIFCVWMWTSSWTEDLTASVLFQVFTYDFADHEDEADGRSDVEFLLGHQLVHAILAGQRSGTVAVGADWSFQLDGSGHAAIFKRQFGISLFGVWKGAAGIQKVHVHKDLNWPVSSSDWTSDLVRLPFVSHWRTQVHSQ